MMFPSPRNSSSKRTGTGDGNNLLLGRAFATRIGLRYSTIFQPHKLGKCAAADRSRFCSWRE